MNLTEQLRSNKFCSLYVQTAATIADNYGLDWKIVREIVYLAHDDWKDEFQKCISSERPPIEPNTPQFALRILGPHLCKPCVSYTVRKPLSGRFQDLQNLIVAHPAAFTALDFLRSVHLSFCLPMKSNVIPIVREVSTLEYGSLKRILEDTSRNPSAIQQYAKLLLLPEYNLITKS